MVSAALKRRVGYSLAYEGIAIVCTTGLLMLLGSSPLRALPLAVATSVLAIVWNLVWNTLFENLEKRFFKKGRSVFVRVAHAVGFEGGLALMCIPLLAWWLGLTLAEALFAEIGLLAFFLVYTYVFNYVFDKLFGLPESAKAIDPHNVTQHTSCTPK